MNTPRRFLVLTVLAGGLAGVDLDDFTDDDRDDRATVSALDADDADDADGDERPEVALWRAAMAPEPAPVEVVFPEPLPLGPLTRPRGGLRPPVFGERRGDWMRGSHLTRATAAAGLALVTCPDSLGCESDRPGARLSEPRQRARRRGTSSACRRSSPPDTRGERHGGRSEPRVPAARLYAPVPQVRSEGGPEPSPPGDA